VPTSKISIIAICTDQRGAGGECFAIVDDAGLGRGAAHVEGDRVLQPERVTKRLGADDAGRRPGFQHLHAVILGLIRVVESARRLHDQKRAGEPAAANAVLDLAEITPHDRPDIGVGDHRRAALEFAIFLGEFMRGGDEHLRMVPLQDRLGARFMVALGVAVEKQDRGRLHAEPREHAAERLDLLLVERSLDFAVGQHALLDLEAQRPLDQRLVLVEEQIVGIRPVDAADLVDVAEALGDEERGLGALALQDGIDGDGGAVEKQSSGLVIAARLLNPGVDPLDQPLRRR
jgi:hypothetical protein